jgi:hypothetical protein
MKNSKADPLKEFNNLFIEQTPKTPLVDFNQFNGELLLSGRSIPENASKLYEPIFNWVSQYANNPRPTTNLRLNLEYFNTASSIWLVKVLRALALISDPDNILIIHLYLAVEDYDDIQEFEDIKESFAPLSAIFHDGGPSTGIKLYGTDEKSKILKEKLVFF